MKINFTPPFISLLALLLTGLLVWGCEETIEPETFGSINGQVTYSSNDEPVENASITTNPPTEALLTTEEGTFQINRVPTGTVSLSIKKSGYKTETLNITVREGQTTQAFVKLSKSEGGNSAPLAPGEPVPPTGSLDQPTNLTLGWSPATDPEGDSIRYDIILYESDSTNGQLVAQDVFDTTYMVENLRFNTAYYWQVIAKDSSDHLTTGPVWSFKTGPYPQNRLLFARDLGANYEIFSTDTSQEAGELRLTNLPSREWRPLLSPINDRVAFSSNAEVENHIYTMTPKGNDLFRVTTLPIAGYHNNGLGFCWSPDGGELLYSHYDMLYKTHRGGFNLRPVAQAPEGMHWRECDWTAQDGGKIVAMAIGSNIYNAGIYLMDADGSNMIQIVGNEPGGLGGPSFSVDGQKVLFTRDISGFESAQGDGRQLDSHIFLLDLNTNEVTDLSGNKPAGTNDLFPRFSANGAKIVFANRSNDGSGNSDVYIMDADGSGRVLVAENGTTPSWD